MSALAESVPELQAQMREALEGPGRVVAVGSGSKSGLAPPEDLGPQEPPVARIEVSGLRGMIEYDPAELTFTALAGTSLGAIEAELQANGQYLPFDPPLRSAGATIGGTVAAGLAGPGGLGGGGVRDFVIGVRMLDGTGRLVAGGGRVVKNAAGFDLPKLMVGSLGRLGVMVELSLKVFPAPAGTLTRAFRFGTFGEALDGLSALARGPVACEALELIPPGIVIARLAGDAELLPARAGRLESVVGLPAEDFPAETWAAWADLVAPGAPLEETGVVARIPVTRRFCGALERALEELGPIVPARRYSLAANLAWVAWPSERPVRELGELLAGLGLTGVPVLGAPAGLEGAPLLGAPSDGGAFGDRIRRALDPHGRLLPLWSLGGER